ncbi:G2/mitotic-specific cyclin-B3 isoform X2 [Cylas formicarius]|uniref:G2/mitotic-specific cyclin-B3 isoform X2 n=1 Tax=Cylas formicarius TaxID=197179 RepID=UPI002958851C|nr:G2/mitotic-specific cyclin-B3 isoform X2 [Cylas formicarius]
MAPLKTTKLYTNNVNKIATRSRAATHLKEINGNKGLERALRGKRKADCSPTKENGNKRTALGELTNNKIDFATGKGIKKVTVQSSVLPSVKTVVKNNKQKENGAPPPAPLNKIITRASLKQTVHHIPNQTAVKSKETQKENNLPPATKKRLSNEFEKTESEPSLYSTALEDAARKSTRLSSKSSESSTIVEQKPSPSNVSLVIQQLESKLNLGNHDVPPGIRDFDKENWNDIYQVSHYAMDIFNYYKEREKMFPIGDYMERQVCLTKMMRSQLVDWMVEIQESFELNHETLYLGVKLVDMYLDRVTVSKEMLQLVGAAAMFIASKFDERIPPMIDDFLYICDGAYTRREMIRMEINLLKIIDFNLGIPISYRFLRRFARCARITMPILTLARYILEFSLMDYDTISIKDSILASAALYMALKMKKVSNWTPTLEFYTGYKLEDFKDTILLLNKGLHRPSREQLMTVRNKYSHKIFFEVATTPLLKDDAFF